MQPSIVILIEFNELCPSLLKGFMEEGQLPNFKRFFEASTVFTTDAREEPPNLEPWIQWVTVHSGMPYCEHNVHHLGDGRKLGYKCLGEVLSDCDVPVGICSSMNTNYSRLNGYLIPDPWDKEGNAYPEWLQIYYRTVAARVQEHSRAVSLGRKSTARFCVFLLRNGMTLNTAQEIVSQLWRDYRDPGLKWIRACLLDRIQYDVFRSLNRRFAVRFATFFSNSTAHFQHYYWRNMAPEQFIIPPPRSDHPSLDEAILYGYRAMDYLIGRFLHDYPDALLTLCTALSQQPWPDTTKRTFRPKRFDKLLEFAEIDPDSVVIKPVMAEQFHIECGSEEKAKLVEEKLKELVLGDQPVMSVRRNGASVFTGCRLTDPSITNQAVIRHPGAKSIEFGEIFYMIHSMRSGRHHADGVLWFRNGKHQIVNEKVSLTTIAPTLLNHFGIARPSHMRSPSLPIY